LNAVETAIEIARNNNALLQILHVTDNSYYQVDKEYREKAQHVFDAMSGNIRHKYGVPAEIIFSEGVAGPVITRIAFEKKPDLIVMGAYGVSGKQDTSIGSNAYYVIKNSECPVLIIPELRKANHFMNVLYPVRPDFGTLQQFGIVKDIAAGGGTSYFEILAILDDNGTREVDRISGIIDAVEREMNDNEKVKISCSYNVEMNIVEEILQKVSDINADLLIISSTIDAENREFYVGPFSHEIICRTDIPFLTVLNPVHHMAVNS
jgi:nucleotide-binding universal stress UspA family protein